MRRIAFDGSFLVTDIGALKHSITAVADRLGEGDVASRAVYGR